MARTGTGNDGPRGATLVARAVDEFRGSRPAGIGHEGLDLLARVPLLAGLTRSHLRRVARLAELVRYGEGRPIVRLGAKGSAVFVLVEGSVAVRRGPSGRTIARLGPGDFFGELALLDGLPRSASVVATSPVVAIRIERAPFLKLLRDEPVIGVRVMEALAARIRSLDKTSVD
jgi:CRP/FNR family cyclic AMP-dependent transcriptional regulator